MLGLWDVIALAGLVLWYHLARWLCRLLVIGLAAGLGRRALNADSKTRRSSE